MSATKREVRDDQHGTITGYTYGCRCNACRLGKRMYDRENDRNEAAVSAEVLEQVLLAVEREADLDGITTATGARLGELVGISAQSANWAVHRLHDDGRLHIASRVGHGGVLEIHTEGDR